MSTGSCGGRSIGGESLDAWVGREKTAEAVLDSERARLMAATLDRAPRFADGDTLPYGWHWLFFHEPVLASDLGPDGHAGLGGFLPPVPLPRRMWAGGVVDFERPLRLGELATRRSTIRSITAKDGRSGPLYFVVLDHEIGVGGERRLHEEQTLVYRDETAGSRRPPTPLVAPVNAGFEATVTPDPTLLFRYSALTFNGHRIHYDLDYCRDVEGYPGLVVHGPLVATLLLDVCHANNPAVSIERLEYRALSPLFAGRPFVVAGVREGANADLWAANDESGLAMSARATFGGSVG